MFLLSHIKESDFSLFCNLFSRLTVHITVGLNSYSIIKLFFFLLLSGRGFLGWKRFCFLPYLFPHLNPSRGPLHTWEKTLQSPCHSLLDGARSSPADPLLSPPPTLVLTHHLPATKPFCSSRTLSSFSL